jgi:hypothetical protein
VSKRHPFFASLNFYDSKITIAGCANIDFIWLEKDRSGNDILNLWFEAQAANSSSS